MKNKLLREAIYLGIIGLIASGLALYAFRGREHANYRQRQVDALKNALVTPVINLKSAYKNLPPDADPVVIAREVLSPMEVVRAAWQDFYNEKESAYSGLVSGSEQTRVIIKLALVEMDKTIDALKAKSPADFEKSVLEAQHVLDHFTDKIKTEEAFIAVLSWFSVIVIFVAFMGIILWNYFSDSREAEEASRVSKELEKEVNRVETLSGFIEAMATGNYSIELKTDKNDELGATLVTMRDKLKMNAEEDQRRNWSTGGQAQIGEILRANTRSSTDLYDSIIKFVVKYTKSNQGGLFIYNDDDSQNTFLDLVACYAFERKKFLNRRLDVGQGLVGQCFLEKERIHLREIPQDYVRITSGLGGENPKSCLLVPLKVNEEVHGVLELASFGVYQDFEIELVEKFAESIASTISSVKTNESTRMLLERTQQQAEEMKSQEEEMRQNMEELSATQEEMQRKEREYIHRIEELESQVATTAR
jgi:GAF domain